MTVVAGVVDRGIVYMGADSFGSEAGWGSGVVRRDRKIFRKGEYLIGYTSSYRMGQIVRYAMDLPEPYAWEEDLFGFMVARFVPVVRDSFRAAGWLKIEHNVEEGGTFLVGFRGRLFGVDSNFQIFESEDPYDAVGSGFALAEGSLSTSARINQQEGRPEGWPAGDLITPPARIILALEAAEKHNAFVRRPFDVMSTEVV